MIYTSKSAVIFCPTKSWGGIEKNVLVRAKSLAQKGYEIYVVLLKNTFEEKFANLEKVHVKTVTRRGGDLNFFVVLTYVRLLKKLKPYAVFAALKKDWWLVSLTAHLCKVPNTILYLGNIRKIRNGLKYRLVFVFFKAKVLVNSESIRKHLLQTTPFFNQQNLFKINNGIGLPTKKNNTANLLIKPDLQKTGLFLVGCAGWLNKRKGFDLLPEILEKLPKNIHIIHVGEDGLDLNIETLLENCTKATKNRLHFLGHQKDMTPFFGTIDLFLLCSREEGMANVLLESLSYGIPIVSTKAPGSEELLDNGTYGILTEIDDVDDMAKGIMAICKKTTVFDPQDLKSRIANDFSLDRMVEKTEKLFFENI